MYPLPVVSVSAPTVMAPPMVILPLPVVKLSDVAGKETAPVVAIVPDPVVDMDKF